MSARWLSIIGVGEDGLDGLSPAARTLVDEAEVVVGGARHLAMLPADGRERLTWPTPLSALVDRLLSRRGRPTCVLATGDPMHFGVGVTFAKRLAAEEMLIVPHVSAFSLAAARLGWSVDEVDMLTLHGRPIETVQTFLSPGARLLLLSENGQTPGRLAAFLNQAGFGDSGITVLERMGGAHQRIRHAVASRFDLGDVADLNTLAVECRLSPGARWLPRLPGLPDDAFKSDGQLTKREIRAVTLARLMPGPGQLLWDIGAGSGSIAIEWMRADRRCRAIAVERDEGRRRTIAVNSLALGVPKLRIVAGAAPAVLDGLDPPDAIFIGGGLADAAAGLLARCWASLRPGGRLVANAVTLGGEAALMAFQANCGGELTRISVQRAEAVGPHLGWRSLMPVTQLATLKP